MGGNLVPDRALRSSGRVLDLILDKAWKKIEVGELIKREERKLGVRQPKALDADEHWVRDLVQSRNWQANLRQELGLPGRSSPAGQQRKALDEG